MLVMTDWYCNELFDCEAELVDLKVRRLVCDVERFREVQSIIKSMIEILGEAME